MRTTLMLVIILSLMSMFGCCNCDKVVEQTRRDQVMIDVLTTANGWLTEDLKYEKERAANMKSQLAQSANASADPTDALKKAAFNSVRRLTPGADATLCVSAWNADAELEHTTYFLCKTPAANGPKCSARVSKTVDPRGDQLISQIDIGCDLYEELVKNIAKK